MLADRAKINVRGGHGGNGCVSFRREKYVPKGGPDGGDGGHGADVVLRATRQARDLSFFRRKVHLVAPRGQHGSGGGRHGADGVTLVVDVPVGTEVRTPGGDLIADLVAEGQRVRVVAGGEGGRGNTRFVSSRRRAPAFAERGLPGEERWLVLTMKLLADVGLVGLPNAGKSSLLAALTRARPKVAPYPFTTLEPNLGVLTCGERSLVVADIPGLVEGASQGVGLGHRFLAHVERTALLLYIVDASSGAAAVVHALRTVRDELASFRPELARRPALVVLTKCDLITEAEIQTVRARLPGEAPSGSPVIAVSSVDRRGLDDLVHAIERALPEPQAEVAEALPVVLRPPERASNFVVEREGIAFRVRGTTLERLVAKADLENPEAAAYVQVVMERAGVSNALRLAGARPGDTIFVGSEEFEFE
ncbi:MAG: GTPase ObgE [Actinobacteria bacterium]|nr:GTPase ObgE [Actinomycetota bacterium]